MRIRAKTFKGWLKANFSKQELGDLARYGANAGWPGLTHYADTCKLYDRFKGEIWEALLDDTEEFGYKNPFELIATFNGADVGSCEDVETLLVWYMAERTARELTEQE